MNTRLARFRTVGEILSGIGAARALGIYDDFAAFRIAPHLFEVVAEKSIPPGSLKASP
jgi:hypothetical protein